MTPVRCPEKGAARVFTRPEPSARQSWHMRITHRGIQAVRESLRTALEIPAAGLSVDPRLTGFNWSRRP
jgi:hypothetical protein